MKKVFETTYDGHHIQVENKWLGEKLYINGELQDENIGLALRATLTGKLNNDSHEARNIKVALGGFSKIRCKVFIDNVLIPSSHIRIRR
ncbi:hypothetical protein [Bacillus piscicola]|uniref:hypothetical protein n=1 Tax=Bacillus piscicola TaxID=1632684 RepID=UPI001F09117B|nr:hypothetical protein [Bacillus piscicola]